MINQIEKPVKIMRKLWTGFWIIMVIPALASAAGAVLAPLFPLAGALLILSGALAAGWWYMYFRRLGYADSGSEIVIGSGVLIRKSKRLVKSNILWTNCVSLFGKTIVTVLHTGGGSMVVFAETEIAA